MKKQTNECATAESKKCLIDGKCLTEILIYKATVKAQKYIKTYISSTGLSFKDRFTKHKYSLKD